MMLLMSYSYNYGFRCPQTKWERIYNALPVIGLIVAVGVLIWWGIMEATHERYFYGNLMSKRTDVWYSHDTEHTVVHTDADGYTSFSTSGSDETIAHIKYVLTFDDHGSSRELSADSFSARVPYVYADEMAFDKLMRSHIEPPVYTFAKIGEEYSLTVRGWLIDWGIKDMILTKIMPKEGK